MFSNYMCEGRRQNQTLLSLELFHANANTMGPSTQLVPVEGDIFLDWIRNCAKQDEKVIRALKELGNSGNP